MILAEHLELLLGRGRFGERREAAQVAEEAGDVGPVAGEKLLARVGGDELGNLRREEARQLRPLPLDGVDQPRVRDRDRRLIGERLHQLDLLVGERLRNVAAYG